MTTMDKAGIGITIGVLAVVLTIGVGITTDVFDGIPGMQEKPSMPVTQEKPSMSEIQKAPSASYISSSGDVLDRLDFKITEGDVKSMHLDKYSSSLVINMKSTEDGELFVALDEGYIGSDNGMFFVIVGGEESNDYEQAGSDLYISFPAGTEKIEIIGSYVLL
tara:strand:- start:139 stop:627 length:489 start_codon:yes stop_codon:yes gene_type:complete